jgi:Cu-Zn family superoxide dismutase
MQTFSLALAATLAAAAVASAADAPKSAKAELKNAAGGSLGQVTVTEAPNGVLLRIEAKGLPPGWHGLHFHDKGDCSKADFTSAGAHVHAKPVVVHGLLNPEATEAGDLPNLFVAADGTATVELFSNYALADVDGSALVVHASPDDYVTQPIGGAGARIACAVIPAGD